MFYSAYDKNRNVYFYTGRNCRSRAVCRSKIASFVTNSIGVEDEYRNTPNEEILDEFNVRIDEHSRKIETDVVSGRAIPS